MSIHSTPITGRNPDYASNLSFTISPYIFRAPHSLRPLTGTPNPPVVEGYSALTLRAFLTKLTLIRQHSPVRDEFVFSILSSYQFFFLNLLTFFRFRSIALTVSNYAVACRLLRSFHSFNLCGYTPLTGCAGRRNYDKS